MSSTHALHIQMQAEAAALERLCQLIRVRGFQLLNVQAQQQQGSWGIDVVVVGERPLQMLRTQIEKLHSVSHCAERSEFHRSARSGNAELPMQVLGEVPRCGAT